MARSEERNREITYMNERKLQQIDIAGILKKRIPASKQRFIPEFLYRMLSHIIHQNEINEMLRVAYPHTGSKFAEKVLSHLDISIETEGEDNIPPIGERVVFASNHPLGGLDGIALIALLGKHYGDDNIRFMVNDLLMNIEPLNSVFLPINKYGSQARASAEMIDKEYASKRQMIIFPAGLVSRLHKGGTVKDLAWQKTFVRKASEHCRDIVPVRFVALNRPRFYRLARLRQLLGIRINLEQATLPAELCALHGTHFRIIFGKKVSISELKASGKTARIIAAEFRDKVYNLQAPEKLRQ